MKQLRSFYMSAGLAAILLIAGCGNNDIEANMDVKMQEFEHTNQNNEKVSLDDLKGTVWIADLIFTSCTTVCQPMTKNMADLQKMLEEEGIKDYRLVSFSVDPEVDTPEKLKEYISHFDADEKKWDLLTGYDQDYISDFAQKNLQTLAIPDPKSNQVSHGTSFYLVNKEGTVVKSYSGTGEVPFEEIVQDVETLIERE